jgi:hypothetical protein
MDKLDLTAQINSMRNAKRIYRDSVANFVIENLETFPFLVELTFGDQKEIAIKSSWVLELVCLQNIDLLTPYIDYFTENIDKPSNESILRPLAKICFLIAKAYYSKTDHQIRSGLTEQHKNKIVEVTFDWLINDHKVANQVFAMDTLFLFGKEFDWIPNELKLVLEKQIQCGSPGYQVRAKRILKKLNI